METIRLADYARVVFFTGAGISAESGVPTYRGRGGIWGQYNWEDYACQRAFDRDPAKVLDFHEQRRTRVLACQPNAAHRRLAELQQSHDGVSIITQNTDGLHPRSGARSTIELHGSLWRLRCARHGALEDWNAGRYQRRECPQCGNTLRPDIVWFEDPVDSAVFHTAEQRIGCCELFVAVGTSAIVWPAAGLIQLAQESGARRVEVNIDATELSPLFDLNLRGPAARIIPEYFSLPVPARGRDAVVPT